MTRGRKTVIGVLVIALLALAYSTERFLSVNAPVDADVLVLEAWFWSRPATEEAVTVFQEGNYRWMLVVGGIPADQPDAKSSADHAAKRLAQYGIDPDRLVLLSDPDRDEHRTYGSARLVRDWIAAERPDCRAVNVFTLGVHARKSRALFRRALGPEIEVGILSGTETSYHRATWCFSGRGLYLVVRNLVGYLYALLYQPGEPG